MVALSIMTLAGLGLVTATILAIASRVFYVQEDPRVEAVLEVLPGANCGGCGYAGCEGYAIAVVNNADIPASLCCAGGDAVCIQVGELTGKAVGASDPLRSFRRCDKVTGKVAPRYDYQGIPSCASAALLFGGTDRCSYSCLGLGDCVEVCPFDAISIRDGLSHINLSKCTGCGLCISACPRNSLELIPVRARIAISCSTKDKLKSVMEVCNVGCINCGKCIKVCPAKAISTPHGRIEINQRLCLSYGVDCKEACIDACPRHIIRPLRPRTFVEEQGKELQPLSPTTEQAGGSAV